MNPTFYEIYKTAEDATPLFSDYMTPSRANQLRGIGFHVVRIY